MVVVKRLKPTKSINYSVLDHSLGLILFCLYMANHHITISARITAYSFFVTVSHEMYSILAYTEHLTQPNELSF